MPNLIWMAAAGRSFAFAMLLATFPLACHSGPRQPGPAQTSRTQVDTIDPATVESAIALICKPQDITRSSSGAVSGCRTCPEGTDFRNETQSTWELTAATPGHFTSAQDSNLLLSGSGCDSHANNFGGTFVFDLQSGKLRLLRYDQGLITNQCHKFDFPDGRSFLVCRASWGGQGLNSESILTASFSSIGQETVKFLISTNDTTGTCGENGVTMVQKSEITDLRFAPAESGAIKSLTVTLTLGSVPCSRTENAANHEKWASAVKAYSVEFQFDGQHFNPTPASFPAYHKFERN